MQITEEQYRRIEDCLPRPRGNVSLSNLEVITTIPPVAEQGCKWRGRPQRLGNWPTIYTRMNRWSKAGVLDRVLARLQAEQIIARKREVVPLDRTILKGHPDGTGALKKRPASHRQIPRRLDHQDSLGCRACSVRLAFRPLPGPGGRCAPRPCTPAGGRARTARLPPAHGPRLRGP